MKGRPEGQGSLSFLKIQGAGNDFVVLDFRAESPLKLTPPFVRFILDRHRGIGADGLLVLRRDALGVLVDFRNSDGNPSDFCGNGARCAAALLLEDQQGPIQFRLMKVSVEAVRSETGIAVRVGPAEHRELPELSRLRPRPAALVRVGVDHWIVPVGDVNGLDVAGLAQGLRHHPWPGPKGANVTFVERRRNELRLRHFERGVEGETLSCGSGSVAAAHWALDGGKGPITIATRGGDLMRVWRDEGGQYWLDGPVEIAFTGTWPLAARVPAWAQDAPSSGKRG